ncbi:hypothetical protein IL306_000852, partial [Fusarium sp. DS 682]
PSFAQGHFHGAIDWTSGTAGLSASSVSNQNAGMSTGIMSGMVGFGSMKEPGKFGNNEWSMHEPASNKLPHIGANWTSGSVESVGSGSMYEYGQNMGKAIRVDKENNDEQRGYSLDFGSFA